MALPKLMVLTLDQYRLLDAADPNGFFDRDHRDQVLRLLNKLDNFRRDCSRLESALRKKFRGRPLNLHIPKGTVTRDALSLAGALMLGGRHEADVNIGGGLVVTETGKLTGRVETASVVCRGVIRGDILARGTVHLCAQGRIEGNVEAACLQIEDGARFSGHCHLEPDLKPKPAGAWASVLKLLGVK